MIAVIMGRFPFDQKFRKFRVGERMEQTFSGISFRKFGCTLRGWPKIPENSVPFDHSYSCLVSPSLEIEFNMADPQNMRLGSLSTLVPKSYRSEGQPRSTRNEFPSRGVFGNRRLFQYGGLYSFS